MTDPFARFSAFEYDTAFDSIGDLAAFLLNRENHAPVYYKLREQVDVIVHQAPPGSTPIWSDWAADTLAELPEAAGLFAGLEDADARRLAWAVLDRAVELMREGKA